MEFVGVGGWRDLRTVGARRISGIIQMRMARAMPEAGSGLGVGVRERVEGGQRRDGWGA